MKKQEYIFDLIKKMTKGEKIYFKRFASTFEQKNKTYITLFDAIDRQKKYDETALKKKLEGESFVKYFAVAKNNLFNLILKSLRVYHANKTTFDQVLNIKKDIFILKDKGLLHIAESQMNKGIKIAQKANLLTEQLLFAHWEVNFQAQNFFLEQSYTAIYELIDKKINIAEQLLSYFQYVALAQKIDILIIRKSLQSPEDWKQLETLFHHPLLQSAAPDLWTAQIYYYHARASYFYAKKDFKAYTIEVKKHLQLFENQNNTANKVEPAAYINLLGTYLNVCIYVEEWEVIEEQIQQYILLLEKNKKENFIKHGFERRKFEATYILPIRYAQVHQKFGEGLKLVTNSLPIFQELKNSGNLNEYYHIKYSYLFTCIFFYNSLFEKSHELISDLLKNKNLKKYPNFLRSIHCLNILLHFEKKDYEYLKYLLKNTQLFLTRQEELYHFEQNLFFLLKKLLKTRDKKEKLGLFEYYAAVFEDLKAQDQHIRDTFVNLDIQWWIRQQTAKLETSSTPHPK